MKNHCLSLIYIPLLPMFFLAIGFPANAQTSRRDYMTDEEIELVRDAQDIDERVDVLTRMVDRRFAVLKIGVGGPVVSAKESGKWGALPSGTRTELLDDIRKLLQKAIDDIDNVAEHPINYAADKDRTEKQKKRDAQRFPSAVRGLAAAAQRYRPALRSLLDKASDEKEKGLILDAIDSCDEVAAAVAKLPS